MIEKFNKENGESNERYIDCMAISLGFSLLVAMAFVAVIIYLLFSGAVDLIDFLNNYGR